MEGFISQDDTEAVLKRVMDDGSFDKMRHKVIDQIKQNVRLSAAGASTFALGVLNAKSLWCRRTLSAGQSSLCAAARPWQLQEQGLARRRICSRLYAEKSSMIKELLAMPQVDEEDGPSTDVFAYAGMRCSMKP